MREDICTIPVSEAFEKNDGCPICRMYTTIENRIIEYIMGAAMMEPDIRIETNKLGFCQHHLEQMNSRRGRLQFALMLQTHTEDMHKDLFKHGISLKRSVNIDKLDSRLQSCFVCEKIQWGFKRMIDTVLRTFENDRDFREIFAKQDVYCLEHYSLLIKTASKRNMRRYYDEFKDMLEEKASNYLEELSLDLKKYCSMYDYRKSNKDADWGNSKDSIERAIKFLTGHEK